MATESSRSADPFGLVGEVLAGRFRIDRVVAEGGFGVVYRAQQIALDRAVAIKVFKTAPDLRDETFEAEAKTIARLKHPNIVEVYDFGVSEAGSERALHWMALEWLEGQTLEALLAQRRGRGEARMPPHEALALLAPAIEAVACGHGERVAHCDLKPGNIFVCQARGAPLLKVLDFGIAKLTQDAAADPAAGAAATTRGFLSFTPDYAAPEQVSYGRTGPWTDVHALGLMLTEMLTGGPPYAARSTEERFEAAISERRPTPASKGVDVGPWEPVLTKALARRPADRYQDASALLGALTGSLGQAAPSRPRFALSRLRLLGAAAALIAAASYAGWRATHLSARGAPARIMMAVLPFEDFSGDAKQEYFADGLTEGMISELGRMAPDRLAVIARTSVTQYRKTRKTARDIGRELGVQYLLEASVARGPDRVRINAHLVRTDDQAQIWSDTFEREIKDVLALQGEVARAIAAPVRLKLTPGDAVVPPGRRSLNPAAYDAYLRGRQLSEKDAPGPEGLFFRGAGALPFYEEAIRLDPGYAPPYVGLASIYGVMGNMLRKSGKDAVGMRSKARATVLHALELDDRFAPAHAVLADMLFEEDRNWTDADRRYRRALALDPNSADVRLSYGNFLRASRRTTEGLAEIKVAVELNPISSRAKVTLGSAYYEARKYEEAIVQLEGLTRSDPGYFRAHYRLAEVFLAQGHFEEALAEIKKIGTEWSDRYVGSTALRGHILARAGREREATATLEQMKRAPEYPPEQIALVNVGLGRYDDAMACLERLYREGDLYLPSLVDPILDRLRTHPGFVDLLRRVGIPAEPR